MRGKTIGVDMMPNWRSLEENPNQQPTADDVEAARMLLSLFDTLDKVYERKVALGDFKLAEVIWDRREYQNAKQVRDDLSLYFAQIGVNPEQRGSESPSLRITDQDLS